MTSAMVAPIWHTEVKQLSDLHEWEQNPRIITEESYEKLKQRINKRGFHDVLKVSLDNKVLSGNQRLKALKELGFEEIECKIPDRELTKDEEDLVAIESNKEDGAWDYDKLSAEYEKDLLLEAGFKDFEVGAIEQMGDEFESFEAGEKKAGDSSRILMIFTFNTKEDRDIVQEWLGTRETTLDGETLISKANEAQG